jgi:hypothetical protein
MMKHIADLNVKLPVQVEYRMDIEGNILLDSVKVQGPSNEVLDVLPLLSEDDLFDISSQLHNWHEDHEE